VKEISLDHAAEVLEKGEILIYPTETLYGLGVDIANPRALERLFSLKQRDSHKPVSVLVGSPQQLPGVAQPLSPLAQFLWDHFLPGPLTLVLPAQASLDPRIHGGSGWVGVRYSSYPWLKILMAGFCRPITTTSANLSGQVGGQKVQQLWGDFKEEDHVYLLNGGDLPPSKGSTVVKVDGDRLMLIREGDIPFEKITVIARSEATKQSYPF
jgi:L-threonylcarbamoyladenylate synthase